MSRPMPEIVSAAGPPDRVTQKNDALSIVSVKVVFDMQFQSRPSPGSRPPCIPDHLFFIRDDEGGGP